MTRVWTVLAKLSPPSPEVVALLRTDGDAVGGLEADAWLATPLFTLLKGS